MAIRFYKSEGISGPLVSHDSDEESILAAFLQADVSKSQKVRNMIWDKLQSAENKKKKSSYPGIATTIFITPDEVEIRDNHMLFDEPKSYKCSLGQFISIYKDWEDFVNRNF